MKKATFLLAISAMCCMLLACAQSQSALNRSSNFDLPKNIGIFGYSPVSYFEKNLAERGDPQYSYLYKKKVYYFASADQIDTFKINPTKYLPRYGEYCPYSLSLGRRVAIDPANFKIRDGKLLLFHDKFELDNVNIPGQRDLFDKADKEYKLLTF